MAEEDGGAQGDRQRSAGPRYVRKTAVYSQSQGRYRAGPARKHPGSHQPPLRPDGGPKRRLDAAGVHRYGHRLHRNRAGVARRSDEVDRRNQRPDRAAGATADHRSRATAGLGHPRRAVRRPGADSLPHRRRAGRARQPAPAVAGRLALAHQDSGQYRHRRTPPPPGRPHQGDAWARSSSTCGSASCRPTTGSRRSCGCWTKTASGWAFGSSGCRRTIFDSSKTSSAAPTGSSW